ncbi:bacteriocin immunity protein [Vibrio campbellii]|uniref:Bacteriocin immunity protein n=1 Tax=Vibrio campbellii TaxID=680 RepID=A0ABY5ING5_9VIBR|nr:bacteriocin immunity protein [Vibrio campbellii]UTZ25245.1 bacteriocin immunity protein [Vibrio campbellii]UTZ35175.1 bacteriocin immunity protein [Vibrio campbellii]
MLKRKNTLNAYTEADFINLLNEIIESKGSDDYQDKLLEHFILITEHPAGSDLIYYPENPGEDTPEGIVKIVKDWRVSQGLPCFKE